MSAPDPVLLMDCAAVSPRLIDAHPAAAGPFHELAERGRRVGLTPVFPAVTCTVQASLSTGRHPRDHGIVANGFHDRVRMETAFWEQSDRLVEAERVWTRIRRRTGKRLKSAMLFWQNSLASDHDVIVTPRPVHRHDGGMILSCYSRPPSLYDRLAAERGAFPLHKYWGPLAGYASTEWIIRCVLHILANERPDLTLCYLPHMDYSLQREGPAGPNIAGDLAQLSEGLARVLQLCAEQGVRVALVGEYGITAVARAIPLNRKLRAAGLLAVRPVEGMEYLDLPGSEAFAMVDHQIAHIYCRDGAAGRTAETLSAVPGVEAVLPPDDPSMRCGHARAGDLIAVSAADAWFSYPWWENPKRAPDFAREVDIHLKPGYDPCELFKEGFRLKIPPFYVSTDTSRVKGSHGRLPDDPADGGLLITDLDLPAEFQDDPLPMTRVSDMLEAHFCGDVESPAGARPDNGDDTA